MLSTKTLEFFLNLLGNITVRGDRPDFEAMTQKMIRMRQEITAELAKLSEGNVQQAQGEKINETAQEEPVS